MAERVPLKLDRLNLVPVDHSLICPKCNAFKMGRTMVLDSPGFECFNHKCGYVLTLTQVRSTKRLEMILDWESNAKRLGQYVVAIAAPLLLLFSVAWVNGYDVDIDENGVSVNWQSLQDWPENFLQNHSLDDVLLPSWER